MHATAIAVGLLALGLATTAGVASRIYLDGPPPRHTGGFGEPDCSDCHFDNPLNAGGGEIRIWGFPESYEPGTSYTVTLEIRRAEMVRAGFQAAVRYARGEGAGLQAGAVRAMDDRVAFLDVDSVRYLHQTVPGTMLVDEVGRWFFEWTAPVSGDPVILHAAANAANGDNSEFGDFIYLASARSRAGR
jgi:hypothetical protein